MSEARIGFIGLGVMGEPMCRNLARKSGCTVLGFDRSPQPLERLRAHGVEAAASVAAIAEKCLTIFLALPSFIPMPIGNNAIFLRISSPMRYQPSRLTDVFEITYIVTKSQKHVKACKVFKGSRLQISAFAEYRQNLLYS